MNKLLINSICAATVSSSGDATKIAEASQLDFTGRLVIGIVLVLLATVATFAIFTFCTGSRRPSDGLKAVFTVFGTCFVIGEFIYCMGSEGSETQHIGDILASIGLVAMLILMTVSFIHFLIEDHEDTCDYDDRHRSRGRDKLSDEDLDRLADEIADKLRHDKR